MKSYAAVDSIEGKFACCEVELLSFEESQSVSYLDKETLIVNIPMEMICQVVDDVSERDVLIIEHEAGEVLSILHRDEAEMIRRIQEYREIMQS